LEESGKEVMRNEISRRFARRIVHRWEVDRLKLHWISGSDL
ncbi:hypothetical protein LCGC14_2429950, partial [marine sediment metagenome]